VVWSFWKFERTAAFRVVRDANMDWKALAKAARPPVPEELLPNVIPALESLESALGRLEQRLPPDALPWPAEDEE